MGGVEAVLGVVMVLVDVEEEFTCRSMLLKGKRGALTKKGYAVAAAVEDCEVGVDDPAFFCFRHQNRSGIKQQRIQRNKHF